ncbi:MAG: 50S ribosomal protein L10 [Thermotoga sp. 50_1627]|uniref:50S ribosomal protein L10 n=1 Tax=Pseudothermotoga sp. TaxID=2033661 RepID=UPI00076D1F42|nr:MAG: 50S ribosomal protein L10 [Thermotoga sp. 50_64]KUK24823.1 MAG: 50S ribosomal protein L10 [Thermotoga sp. 50_1627]MBC7116544.1 50S ribosomal protein L10 [Pseudothermotoga sp.]MDK2923828.1 large subunit ribosomal protein [Pseudothermotoga sp.]HBT40218.1 50S ribosomal protein L10 [Pseudothermotoga sp.]
MLTREKKQQILENLKDVFPKANLLVFVNFFGLDVATMRELRRRISSKHGKDARFTVVKNSLLSIVLNEIGYQKADYERFLRGPTAIFYSLSGDPVDALKTLASFAKEKKLEKFFKGGFIEHQPFDAEQVAHFASLPTKKELYAILVGRIQSPIYGLVFALNDIIRKLVYVLNAIEEKKKSENVGGV